MPNEFNSITALEVTAFGTSLKVKIKMNKELKEKLEEHYGVDCAFKLIVSTVLNLVEHGTDDDDDVDGHSYELTLPREA